jgi:hypothetical protein
MTALLLALAVIGYFLIGALYLVAYILTFRPEPRDAQLGLTLLFWWAYMVIEIVVALAYYAGKFGKATAQKLEG